MAVSVALGLVLALGATRAAAQTIDTIAGGEIGDGGSALDAFLAAPSAALADAAGNVYIADTDNHRVRRVDTAGNIATVVGIGTSGTTGDGGPGTLARINRPIALAFDKSGRLLILDQDACIRRWDPATTVVTTYAGQCGVYGDPGDGGPAAAAHLSFPSDLAVAPNGDVFVADEGIVRRISAATGVIDVFAGDGQTGANADGTPARSAHLGVSIDGLAVDADGNVYASYDAGGEQHVTEIEAGSLTTRLVARGSYTSGLDDPGQGAALQQNVVAGELAIRNGRELLLYDTNLERIRDVDLTTRTIRTIVGGGDSVAENASGVGTQIVLFGTFHLSADAHGNVIFGDYRFDVRVWNAAADTVKTIATLHDPIGDGKPALSATLLFPEGLTLDPSGRLVITEPFRDRIRVLGTDGTIDTLIGGGASPLQPGRASTPREVEVFAESAAFDAKGRLVFGDFITSSIARYDPTANNVTVIAGGNSYASSGDGGPATAASLEDPISIAIASDGTIYFLDDYAYRIRKIQPDGTIAAVAGNGSDTVSGDGGLATSAGLGFSVAIALDGRGGLYFASHDGSTHGGLIRRIDLATGVVTLFAGGGAVEGEGQHAKDAYFQGEFRSLAFDAAGNLYGFLDFPEEIVVIDGAGVVRVVNDMPDQPFGYGFSGDGGPVSHASFDGGYLALGSGGTIYVSDTFNNRVRKVGACASVGGFSLVAPASGASGVAPGSVTLTWSAASGAFRYDVYLDTANPPARLVASDVASTALQTGALLPATTYAWRVVAKGDPYCPAPSSTSSTVRTFSTTGLCAAPGGFATQSPADGAAGVAAPTTLTWSAAPGASVYDVYLGTGDPPPLLASGVSSTSFAASSLTTGSTYNWRVVAHASCDPSLTSSTARARFTVGGACASPPAFSLLSPPDGSAGRPNALTLTWSPVPGAASYDVYLGIGSPGAAPLASGLTGTTFLATGLTLGAGYRWKIVAHAACDASKTTTAGPFAFTVASTCAPPAAFSYELTPSGPVTVDQAYVISWTAAEGADTAAGAFYRVERSASSSFSPVLDSLDTTARSASFTGKETGTLYHRVTAYSSCGAASAPTPALAVVIASDLPRLVFTRQAEPVIVKTGTDLVTITSTVDVKNVSRQDFIGSLNAIQPIPFFRPDDLTLGIRAGETKTLTLRYTGVPTNVEGRYDGLLYVTGLQAAPLDVVPYVTVALVVSAAGGNGAKPVFGADTVAFPPTPASQDPPPITVTLTNPGSVPIAVAGQVGPEVWLRPDAGWNATPLAPGETRTITLRCARVFALSGGTFPHYTYFTVSTKDGRSARLLVRDETPADTDLCASRGRLGAGAPSLVVPSVANVRSALGNTFVSKLAVGNLGSDDAAVDLFYTPDGSSGFDCAHVLARRLTVKAGDVLSLTDPLGVLFGASGSGSVELRSARIAQLSVKSSVDAAAASGGTFGFIMPAVPRGAGVRAGQTHLLNGLVWNASYRTNLILAETTGDDTTSVTISLFDANGNALGAPRSVSVLPYGKTQLRLVDVAGGEFANASAVIQGGSGLGAVLGLVTVIDNKNDDAATFLARSLAGPPATRRRGAGTAAESPLAVSSVSFVIPALVTGYASTRIPGAPWTFQSSMAITNGTGSPASITLTYRPLERLQQGGSPIVKTVSIPPRGSVAWDNALVDLFGIGSAEKSNGPMLIQGDTTRTIVSSRVFSKTDQGTFGDAIPVLPSTTELGTGAKQVITLETEGLESSLVANGADARGVRSNLILAEVLGKPVTVTVQLWEKGDRKKPIASRTVTLAAYDKQQLSPVFEGDTGTKDRTNVRVTVTADLSSDGKAVALVTRVDNITADTKNLLLAPVGSATAPPSIGF